MRVRAMELGGRGVDMRYDRIEYAIRVGCMLYL